MIGDGCPNLTVLKFNDLVCVYRDTTVLGKGTVVSTTAHIFHRVTARGDHRAKEELDARTVSNSVSKTKVASPIVRVGTIDSNCPASTCRNSRNDGIGVPTNVHKHVVLGTVYGSVPGGSCSWSINGEACRTTGGFCSSGSCEDCRARPT